MVLTRRRMLEIGGLGLLSLGIPSADSNEILSADGNEPARQPEPPISLEKPADYSLTILPPSRFYHCHYWR